MAIKQLGDLAVGTVVKIKISNVMTEFLIPQQGKPSDAYIGFENATWLLQKNLPIQCVWDGTDNDYANSDIHSWENGPYFNSIDEKIRNEILTVKIPYRKGSGTSLSVSSGENGLSCKVFSLSEYEYNIHFSDTTYSPVDGSVLSYFSNNASSKVIATFNGEAAGQWTRTPFVKNGSDQVSAIMSNGSWYNAQLNYDSSMGNIWCARPAFALPSSLYVNDAGEVITNQPPTAPGSIDVSGVVRGQTATITLTAATDPDGTVESYIFERQVDSGAWQQVAQVNSLTQTDTIGEDWGTVAYRACAVDDMGASGPYVTGETFTVNSGWVVVSGPAEELGSKAAPFDLDFSVSISGVPSVDAITVSAARDGEQIYSGTPSAGEQISVPIDTRLLGAGEHAIEVQASKDDYLPASKHYTFTIPAVTIPAGGTGEQAQGPDGRPVFHKTLARLCVGTGGVDIQAQVDALTARVKTLEG